MSEIVRRVALAIKAKIAQDHGDHFDDDEDGLYCSDSNRGFNTEDLQAIARAAVEAMKGPTEAMLEAGRNAQACFDSRFEEHNAGEIFEAMLGQALSENDT